MPKLTNSKLSIQKYTIYHNNKRSSLFFKCFLLQNKAAFTRACKKAFNKLSYTASSKKKVAQDLDDADGELSDESDDDDDITKDKMIVVIIIFKINTDCLECIHFLRQKLNLQRKLKVTLRSNPRKKPNPSRKSRKNRNEVIFLVINILTLVFCMKYTVLYLYEVVFLDSLSVPSLNNILLTPPKLQNKNEILWLLILLGFETNSF